MEAVLGLIEDVLRVGLESGSIDFLAAVCGQAMHYERARSGERNHSSVDLVPAHLADTVSRLLLPAHRDPDIRVEQVRARSGCVDIFGEHDLAPRPLDKIGGRLKAFGGGNAQLKPGLARGKERRVGKE